MKLKLSFFVVLVFSFFNFPTLDSQVRYRSKNQIDLKPKEIRKLTLIHLEGKDKKFPDSYLLGMRDDNLILATDISKDFRGKANFVKSEINLKNYDYLTMLERKEKHRKMALWGAICGAAGYYLTQQYAAPSRYEARNKILLGQSPNNGVAEGIIGGITGAAFGIILGRELAKKRINLKGQRRKAMRKLKEIKFYN